MILPAGAVTLIASKSKTRVLDMWVYVGVFGVLQWVIFLSLLIVIIAIFGASFFTRNRNLEGTFSDRFISGFCMVYMFTLQMGSYLNTESPTAKVVQLTASMLTMVMFAYYTTGIKLHIVWLSDPEIALVWNPCEYCK